jgi:thioredoxin 1
MGTPALIAIVAIIIVGAGATYFAMKPEGEKMMAQGEAMMEAGEKMMEEGTLMKEEGEAMMQGDEGMMENRTGSYEAYAPEKLAQAETGDVVLFFSASWCPTCRALNNDIEKNRTAIPANVTILQVDYDKETALRQKYGVTRQHTMVQVAADGSEIEQWSGSRNLSALLSQIQ